MWFWYSLSAAVLGAIAFTINKKALHHVNASVLSWALFALPTPFLLLVIPFTGWPKLSWIFFAAATTSSLAFVYSKTITFQSIQKAALSRIIPLGSFNTFFTYILAFLFLHEHISLLGVGGLTTIIIGAYLLNVDNAKEGLWQPFVTLIKDPPARIYVFAMLFFSISALCDKTALLHMSPTNPAIQLLFENFIMTVAITPYLYKTHPGWVKELKTHFPILFINSIIYLLLSFLVFVAIINGPIALANAVKQLQVLFIFVLSFIFFKDKPTKHVLLAALLMILGVLLIKIA